MSEDEKKVEVEPIVTPVVEAQVDLNEVAAVEAAIEMEGGEKWGFDSATFIVVEDGPVGEEVATALKEKRGTGEDKDDDGVTWVLSMDGELEAVKRLLPEGGKIMIIQDIDILQNEDDFGDIAGLGYDAVDDVIDLVEEWNNDNLDNQVDLRILFNSSNPASDERTSIIDSGPVRNKLDAVKKIEELFESGKV